MATEANSAVPSPPIPSSSNDETCALPTQGGPQIALAQDGFPHLTGYQVISPLGAGGMGIVWRARQVGTRRDVALKFLRDGALSSDRARSRFTREVQLAARLQHPHIARIYDSGIHCGVYYYAMELVEGLRLDHHVKQKELDRAAIVRLMHSICQAVEHAHTRGIIHRDLKPSNLMVTSDGEPRVLDFGLAREILQDDSDPMATREGDMAGTPAFMSPEQAAGSLRLIGTASDVYSLGVILYLLLTGAMPHDVTGTVDEVRRRIASIDVFRPRTTDHSVPRELEAILLKALARDPSRRYATAAALADDLNRYLSGKTVKARPWTARYAAAKWAVKHRRRASAVALTVLVAALGGGAYAQWHEARGHDALIRQQEGDLRDMASILSRVMEFEKPGQPPRVPRVREGLKHEADLAAARFGVRPALLGKVLDAIGMALYARGWYEDAQRLVSTALNARLADPTVPLTERLESMNNRSEVLRELGQFEEAEAAARQAIDAAVGTDLNPEAQRAQINLAYALDEQGSYSSAEIAANRAIILGESLRSSRPREYWKAVNALAFVLRDEGKLAEAEAKAREALDGRRADFTDDDQDTIQSMHTMATILSLSDDRLDEAEKWVRKSLDGSVSLGADHPDRLEYETADANIVFRRKRYAEAAGRFDRLLDRSIMVRGESHWATIKLSYDLAAALTEWADQLDAAAKLAEASSGREPPAGFFNPFAAAAARVGQLDAAFQFAEARRKRERVADILGKVVAQRRNVLPAAHPQLLALKEARASALCGAGQLDEALRQYTDVWKTRRASKGDDDPTTLESLMNVARVQRFLRHWSDAEENFRRVYHARARTLVPDDPLTGASLDELNDVLKAQGKSAEAPPAAAQPHR